MVSVRRSNSLKIAQSSAIPNRGAKHIPNTAKAESRSRPTPIWVVTSRATNRVRSEQCGCANSFTRSKFNVIGVFYCSLRQRNQSNQQSSGGEIPANLNTRSSNQLSAHSMQNQKQIKRAKPNRKIHILSNAETELRVVKPGYDSVENRDRGLYREFVYLSRPTIGRCYSLQRILRNVI